MLGAHVRAKPVTATATVRAGAGNYCGFSFRETTGAATATIVIYDATSATGTILDTIQLAQGESAREFYPGGIICENGIHAVVTGTIQGSIRTG